MINALRDFMKLEAASGVLLVVAAVLAMLVANSPLSGLYDALIELPVEIRIGEFEIAKPLLLWINDGLMALFFLPVGLELKREILSGQLATLRQAALPAAGAIGGMLVPALIYTLINYGDPVAMQGWAIPAATDIAFALAVLVLLGERVPLALRVLLVTIAIFDDVGAIVIIALFYTSNLSVAALATAGACVIVLWWLNRRRVMEIAPYLLVGVVMWASVLKSGVHATLAGVVLAMFIPAGSKEGGHSPLEQLEHDLHTAVAWFTLPLFAFANAGISLAGTSADYLLHPVPLGIVAGLLLGKQLGVFGFCWLAVKTGLTTLPAGLSWLQVYGGALLCGIGFTMSLFLAALAFETRGVNLFFDERLGIIVGSLLSGVAGYLVLRFALPAPARPTPAEDNQD
ncbi:MAG: Na+/H+ antiporter NhaA [Woeseiaceae bacterium]|nr:Na+/H+ antiporter NhaA [Woeseiaceae bacterium]